MAKKTDNSTRCQRCGAERLVRVQGHTDDTFYAWVGDEDIDDGYEGYVPSDMGIGGGDDMAFAYCLDCGQIQGRWPRRETKVERHAKKVAARR